MTRHLKKKKCEFGTQKEQEMPILSDDYIQKAESLVRDAILRITREPSPEAYTWLEKAKLNLVACYPHYRQFKIHYRRIVHNIESDVFTGKMIIQNQKNFWSLLGNLLSPDNS
jgi:hypothetical protein